MNIDLIIRRLALLASIALLATATVACERNESTDDEATGQSATDDKADERIAALAATERQTVEVDSSDGRARLSLAVPAGYAAVDNTGGVDGTWQLTEAPDAAPTFTVDLWLGRADDEKMAESFIIDGRVIDPVETDGAWVAAGAEDGTHQVFVNRRHDELGVACEARFQSAGEAAAAVELMREVCLSVQVAPAEASAEASDTPSPDAVDGATAQLRTELAAGKPTPKPEPTGDAVADLEALTAWARAQVVDHGRSPVSACTSVILGAQKLLGGSADEKAAATTALDVCRQELPRWYAEQTVARAERDPAACSKLQLALLPISVPPSAEYTALKARAESACPNVAL